MSKPPVREDLYGKHPNFTPVKTSCLNPSLFRRNPQKILKDALYVVQGVGTISIVCIDV